MIDDAVSPAAIPFSEITEVVVQLAVDGTLSLLQVDFSEDVAQTGNTLIFEASSSLSQGIDSNRFARKKVSRQTTTSDTFEIQDDYFNVYGIPQVGKAVWISAYLIDNATGTRLDLSSYKATVTQAV